MYDAIATETFHLPAGVMANVESVFHSVVQILVWKQDDRVVFKQPWFTEGLS